tara:strand:- start:2171 stop:2974 length:804 start_codon:yes stop_codon:yes gene_type:complete
MLAGGLIYLPQAARQFSSGVIVPVDLVTLADTTNVRAAAPEPVVEDEQPPTPEPETDDEADDNIVPEPVVSEPPPVEEDTVEVIDDGLPDDAVAVTEPAEETPEPPTPRERPDPPRQETPQRQQQAAVDLDYLSGLVDQARESQPRNSGNAEAGARRDGAGAGTAMTATLADMMYSQAAPCYRSSVDAPDPERLNVTVSVRLNRDGSLAEPPISVNSGRIRASGNPFWLVAEERSLAAIIACAPYRLPAEHYSQWRHMEVNFGNDIF